MQNQMDVARMEMQFYTDLFNRYAAGGVSAPNPVSSGPCNEVLVPCPPATHMAASTAEGEGGWGGPSRVPPPLPLVGLGG